MWYAIGIGSFALSGVIIYMRYFAFMGRVLKDHGLDGVKTLVEVMPPPRTAESIAKVVEVVARSRTSPEHHKDVIGDATTGSGDTP